MTALIAASARRRDAWELPEATEVSPYSAQVICNIHDTYGEGAPGSGLVASIHPSVVDMGYEWNGYRWWMANTPWPNRVDSFENPCIYGSNDRINWYVPDGLTNPIEPWDGISGNYNSDVELIWDSDNQRFVCFWRWVGGSLSNVWIRAKVSSDGINWSSTVNLFEPSYTAGSPTVVRHPDGVRWMMLFPSSSQDAFVATDLLGPWTYLQSVPGLRVGHGAVIKYGAGYLSCVRATDPVDSQPYLYVDASPNGLSWDFATKLPDVETIGSAYRPTLQPSTKAGWIDVWSSVSNDATLPGKVGVVYTRLPLSEF